MGSNLGANFTLIGALAGIMFADLLRAKGLRLSYARFARTGLLAMPLVVLATTVAIFFVA